MASNLENYPKSPVTQSGNVKLFEKIPTKLIVDFYQRQEKLDVSKYFENLSEILILECQDTGYKFYYPFEIIGDEEFYRNLQILKESEGLEYDRDPDADHHFAEKYIEKDARILEIGCGTGKFLKLISAKTKNITGLELNTRAAEIAIKSGFDVKKQLVQEFAEIAPGSFDVVCAFQVLEHIAEVKSFLESCLKLLKTNGKLIFSVPNNEPYFQKFSKYEVLNLPPHHLGLWNLKSFEKLENFFPVKLSAHKFSGESRLIVDAYLRAGKFANIKNLPMWQTSAEKLKRLTMLPLAIASSSWDYMNGQKNYAHISVVFQKI